MLEVTGERTPSVRAGRFWSVESKFYSKGGVDHPAGNLMHAGTVHHIVPLDEGSRDPCAQLERSPIGQRSQNQQIGTRRKPGSVDLMHIGHPTALGSEHAGLYSCAPEQRNALAEGAVTA